jgi:hypothetical protein
MPCVRYDLTPYSDMHCGHVWPAWRAYQLSRRLGATFLLQFDDDAYMRRRLWLQSWSLERAEKRFVEDFYWLGIYPDSIKRVSRHQEAAEAAARSLGVGVPEADCEGSEAGTALRGTDPVQGASDKPLQPHSGVVGVCHEWSEILHVVADHENGVTRLVRGMDLHYKSGLYAWLWHRIYGGQPPMQHYERLVVREGAGEKCSKSNTGGISARELRRAGYTGAEVLDTIRELAYRTAEHSLRDVLIPEGLLEPDTHGVLEYDDTRDLRRELETWEQTDNPWVGDVREAITQRLGAM